MSIRLENITALHKTGMGIKILHIHISDQKEGIPHLKLAREEKYHDPPFLDDYIILHGTLPTEC